MKTFFSAWMDGLEKALFRRQVLAVTAAALLAGMGAATTVLYVSGHVQLERHAQKIASHFPLTWMGVEGDPIPKYSSIRKRVVLHNRDAALFNIVGLTGFPPDHSSEVLLEEENPTQVDFRYANQRYQFRFSTPQSLGFLDYLRYGATRSGLFFAFLTGLGGWGLPWLLVWTADGDEKEAPVPIHLRATDDLIEEREPESKHLEYKEVLRWNSQKGDYCKTKEHLALKNIASFLNTEGGTLLVGVSDDIHPVTEDRDRFENIDDAKRHLENIMRRMSPNPVRRDLIEDVRYDRVDGCTILRIDCVPSDEPVFLTDQRRGKEEEQRFYKRTSAASPELEGREMSAYIRNHFSDR
jgi:hypothetical protein